MLGVHQFTTLDAFGKENVELEEEVLHKDFVTGINRSSTYPLWYVSLHQQRVEIFTQAYSLYVQVNASTVAKKVAANELRSSFPA